MTGALEKVEVEALITDRYLEALLAAAERHAPDAPADAALDPAIRSAARRLRDELVRVHPSFRFEDRLARRLAAAAAGLRLAEASGGDAAVIPFPPRILAEAGVEGELANVELMELLGMPDARAGSPAAPGTGTGSRFPFLMGGAVTSAALGLAGAAFVAWRLTRGAPTDPMARAVRLARAARPARDVLPRGLA